MVSYDGSTDTNKGRGIAIIAEISHLLDSQSSDRVNALGDVLMQDIGDKLRREIQRSGWTNYELSRQADISESVLSRFMSGERDLRLETASKLASALKLRLVSQTSKKRRKPAK